MKKLALVALLFAGSATASEKIQYDCDYTFDNHEFNTTVEYKENPPYASLVINGKEYEQPRNTILKNKMRWQMFENTVIIRDTFTGKLSVNTNQITNFKCEIFGA